MALASAPASRLRPFPSSAVRPGGAVSGSVPLPVWLVTVPTRPAVPAGSAPLGGVQVFAVRAGTVRDAIALAGSRAAAPSAVLRRRGAVADLARATAAPAAGGFPA